MKMTAKEIFDKRYLYYRDMLNKPAIPLEARQLIFDVMEEYHQSKVNNSASDDVSVRFLFDFVNEFTDTVIPMEAIEETLKRLNEH